MKDKCPSKVSELESLWKFIDLVDSEGVDKLEVFKMLINKWIYPKDCKIKVTKRHIFITDEHGELRLTHKRAKEAIIHGLVPSMKPNPSGEKDS